jgi:fatty acid desaturase
MHHAFTNRLGLDRALDVGGLVWHERHLPARRRWWTRHQALLFPAAILPFTFLYMLRAGISYLWRRRQRLLLGATVARWIALALWLRSPALLLLPPLLVSWFQALVSSLNHYHLPKAEGPESSHARSMIVRTQNTGTGRLWTWLSGSLNFHVEHHLFPTMPRRHYPRIAPQIRAYCDGHGIPYPLCSPWQAIGRLIRKAHAPLDGRPS